MEFWILWIPDFQTAIGPSPCPSCKLLMTPCNSSFMKLCSWRCPGETIKMLWLFFINTGIIVLQRWKHNMINISQHIYIYIIYIFVIYIYILKYVYIYINIYQQVGNHNLISWKVRTFGLPDTNATALAHEHSSGREIISDPKAPLLQWSSIHLCWQPSWLERMKDVFVSTRHCCPLKSQVTGSKNIPATNSGPTLGFVQPQRSTKTHL